MEYNNSTSLYDCKIVIIEGEGITYKQRLLTEIHYTLVVPTGVQCIIEERHQPIMDNKFYEGTIPFDWQFFISAISPSLQPENDFHLVCPSGIDQATFNNLYEGDTITLFSVFVDVDPCENSVRPHTSGVDPNYMDGNYWNKYKMFTGGDYTGNLITNYECPTSDFNVTYVDMPADGNIKTNDNVSAETTYGPTSTLTAKPSGSVESLVVNTDGTYSFTANTVGNYIYEVPVSPPSSASGNLTSTLNLKVVDYVEPDLRPIANQDIGTTRLNTEITLNTLGNDRCVVSNGCELDATSVTIITPPSQAGNAVVNGVTGDITYTPETNYTGSDTLVYQVCVDGESSNCSIAEQIIIISFIELTPNKTFAADDFISTQQCTPVSGNVLNNDSDKDSDTQSVVAQNMTLPEGTLTLFSTGFYVFEPADSFFGPVDIPYSICDNNLTMACADATLHILVERDFTINIRVYLTGGLLNNGNETGTTHSRPLMRDNLRFSPYTSLRYIPDNDPYSQMNSTTWESGNEKYNHVESGLITKFTFISDPETIFGVEGEDAITDWVFVELRSKLDNTNIISTRSGLVQRDGDVVDLDGVSGLRFPGIEVDDYYVVVRHRNHLGAMTATAMTPAQLNDLVDFTQSSTGIFDFGNSKFGGAYDYTNLAQNPYAKNGYSALWSGDLDGNGKIKYSNPGDDLNTLLSDLLGYEIKDASGNTIDYNFFTNYDFAYGYHIGDLDMNGKSKYDNPNDDKNMLFGQILFYPLNSQFLSNFDFFIEQIPE